MTYSEFANELKYYEYSQEYYDITHSLMEYTLVDKMIENFRFSHTNQYNESINTLKDRGYFVEATGGEERIENLMLEKAEKLQGWWSRVCAAFKRIWGVVKKFFAKFFTKDGWAQIKDEKIFAKLVKGDNAMKEKAINIAREEFKKQDIEIHERGSANLINDLIGLLKGSIKTYNVKMPQSKAVSDFKAFLKSLRKAEKAIADGKVSELAKATKEIAESANKDFVAMPVSNLDDMQDMISDSQSRIGEPEESGSEAAKAINEELTKINAYISNTMTFMTKFKTAVGKIVERFKDLESDSGSVDSDNTSDVVDDSTTNSSKTDDKTGAKKGTRWSPEQIEAGRKFAGDKEGVSKFLSNNSIDEMLANSVTGANKKGVESVKKEIKIKIQNARSELYGAIASYNELVNKYTDVKSKNSSDPSLKSMKSSMDKLQKNIVGAKKTLDSFINLGGSKGEIFTASFDKTTYVFTMTLSKSSEVKNVKIDPGEFNNSSGSKTKDLTSVANADKIIARVLKPIEKLTGLDNDIYDSYKKQLSAEMPSLLKNDDVTNDNGEMKDGPLSVINNILNIYFMSVAADIAKKVFRSVDPNFKHGYLTSSIIDIISNNTSKPLDLINNKGELSKINDNAMRNSANVSKTVTTHMKNKSVTKSRNCTNADVLGDFTNEVLTKYSSINDPNVKTILSKLANINDFTKFKYSDNKTPVLTFDIDGAKNDDKNSTINDIIRKIESKIVFSKDAFDGVDKFYNDRCNTFLRQTLKIHTGTGFKKNLKASQVFHESVLEDIYNEIQLENINQFMEYINTLSQEISYATQDIIFFENTMS